MTGQEVIAIAHACERLVLDFAFYSDRQEYEALGALFAEQGTMSRPTGERLAGPQAIISSYKSQPYGRITRHISTNIRISVESNDLARGWAYAIVYSADPNQEPNAHLGVKSDARHMVGEFEDRFVRTEEGWRFDARIARFVMYTA